MAELSETLQNHGISLPEAQVVALSHYCDKLWELNKQLNLTRHLDYASFVGRDLLDVIEVAKLIEPGEAILDIGSGGGVPGLVLAVIRPDLKVTLSDSVAKKSRALEVLAAAAGVEVEIYAARAESLLEDFRFDTAVARAVGPLDRLLSWLKHHWDVLGRLLAIKGPRWREEREAAIGKRLLNGLNCRVASEYVVPELGWKSTILEIRRH